MEICIKSFRILYFLKSAIPLLLKFYPKETIMAMYKDFATKIFIKALVRRVIFF